MTEPHQRPTPEARGPMVRLVPPALAATAICVANPDPDATYTLTINGTRILETATGRFAVDAIRNHPDIFALMQAWRWIDGDRLRLDRMDIIEITASGQQQPANVVYEQQ